MAVIKQLRWRCRRGTQELDRLLLAYLDNQYPFSTTSQQQSFHDFLTLEDSDLQRYLLGDGTPERQDFSELIAMILNVKNSNFCR